MVSSESSRTHHHTNHRTSILLTGISMINSLVKKHVCIVLAGLHLALANPMPTHSLFFLRGGASESAASWNAGSKYNNYRTSTSPPIRNNYKATSVYAADSKEKTKAAFAEAFLLREDRNRFIGEELSLHPRSIQLLRSSNISIILIHSESLRNIIWTAPIYSWYNTRIPCNP